MYATSTSGDGVDAFSVNQDGVFAYSASKIGAYIEGAASNTNSNEVLAIQSDNGEYLMSAFSKNACGNATSGGYGDCMNLDENGNFNVKGSISDSKGTFSRTRNPNSDLVSYDAQVTEPTIEDVGRAQLVNGSASVPLAADYRQTIDNPNYLVFLTPHGDSKGLYVASESATSFIVRESQGGRSTLAFDYRIVAQQYGAHEGRLPHYATLHPREEENRLASGSSRSRDWASANAEARPRIAMTSMRQQKLLKRAQKRSRFVAPPVHLPSAASFSTH